jgi:hypothetical protein
MNVQKQVLEPVVVEKSVLSPVLINPPVVVRKKLDIFFPSADILTSTKSIGTNTIKKSPEGLFQSFIRVKGSFQPFGKPTSFEKAFQTGVYGVKQSPFALAASFQVRGTKSGKAVPLFGKINPEFRFGRSGRETTTLVQRAPTRLGTRNEAQLIASSRKGGRRSKGGYRPVKWY